MSENKTISRKYVWAAYPVIGLLVIVLFNIRMNIYRSSQSRPLPDDNYVRTGAAPISAERVLANEINLQSAQENLMQNSYLQGLLKNSSSDVRNEARNFGVKAGNTPEIALDNMRTIRSLRESSMQATGPKVTVELARILDDPSLR